MAQKADPKLITGARVFDVFRGLSIGEGKKSIAIEVTLQPRGQAMTDAEIEKVSAAIVASGVEGDRRVSCAASGSLAGRRSSSRTS